MLWVNLPLEVGVEVFFFVLVAVSHVLKPTELFEKIKKDDATNLKKRFIDAFFFLEGIRISEVHDCHATGFLYPPYLVPSPAFLIHDIHISRAISALEQTWLQT